ncbi:hypothetical protein VTN31DRAFT_5649 [Thermomyces dupontii]|uniref:uncharacterized protein n=1 Tax=Talaromyces thermophilus TaxID=28565 RepID=UPI0037446453
MAEPRGSSPMMSPRTLGQSNDLPQIIAHRGYKARFPENTLSAFKGAIAAGCHALEMDVHVSRDGVVVMSHDLSLERCYGVDRQIPDCDWDYLSTLRTVREPHEPMPRLKDVLEYLAAPELDEVWVLLDFKLTNDASRILPLLAETIKSVPPARRPWRERIMLGCWLPYYFPLCKEYLPGFRVVLNTPNTGLAQRVLRDPTTAHVHLNVLQHALLYLGPKLITTAHRQQDDPDRQVFIWTPNSPKAMRRAIRLGVDGVITDDPDSFRQLCERWPEEDIPHRDEDRIGFREGIVLMLVTWLFRFLFWAIGPELLQKLLLRRTVLLKARVKDAGKKK